ncbi:MAG: SRPBCC family protein [Actinobacteria bacterium]|nr:SRPBCC family protein [Actinomycetota bacterium]MBI3688541.1 SRPBCC family protein [Actinomycetota bacterium]
MRSVQLRVRAPYVAPAVAFDRISDFAAYPDLVDVVRSVTVHPVRPDGLVPSDWAVHFRSGILRWSEVDRFDRGVLTIAFDQTSGDFEEFSGLWQVQPAGSGCEVRFDAGFDFGIPSLAGILDPIAARVLTETIAAVLTGLLGEIEIVEDTAAVAAAGAA